MTVLSTLTFERTPPIRPVESDILNGEKLNHPPSVTVPPGFPDAAEFMQIARQVLACSTMIPLATVDISISLGVPSVSNYRTVRVIADDIAIGDITVTDNGNGDTSIVFPAGKLTASSRQPQAHVTGSNPAEISAEQITNGVRVYTKSGGAAVDRNFSVNIF